VFSIFSRYNPAKQDYILFAALFCFSFLMFYPTVFHVGHDLASYLAVAKNFIVGNGMVDVQGGISNHRFGYKLLLAGALWLGQISGDEMFFVIVMQSVFAALTATLTYVLAYTLFDRFTAFLSYGFFILCPTIISNLPEFGLDGVWPVFCLVSLLLFLKQAEQGLSSLRSLFALAFAGVFAALAVWVKESAGLNYAIIPLLLVFALNLDSKVKRLFIFYGAFCLFIYIGGCVVENLGETLGQDSENERLSFLSALAYARGAYSENEVLSFVLFILDGLKGYFFGAHFSMNVNHFYPVFFMVYLSAIFGCYQVIKGEQRRAYIVLFTVLSAYLLYAAWAAQWHMRYMQLVILFVVFSVFVGHFSVSLQRLLWGAGDNVNQARLYKLLSLVFVVSLLSSQFFSSLKEKFYLDDNPVVNKIERISKGRLAAEFDGSDVGLAKLVVRSLNEERNLVITDAVIPASALSFYAPHKVKTKINLYQRVMIGVHENPYIPYFDVESAHNVSFSCLSNVHKKKGKRHVEIMVFDPDYFMAQIEGISHFYILIKGGADCTSYFTQWLDDAAPDFNVDYKVLNIMPRTDYLLYELSYRPRAASKAYKEPSAIKNTQALTDYIGYMREHDSYSYQYYKKNFPFLTINQP
tara:strand:- start:152879 stop:154789 length:1911 start_codon:yes stop_codon:yes gene_type:complete